MDNLLKRLDRLERQNRRLKLAGSLMLIGFAVLVMMGQAKPSNVAKVIEAEKFILRNTDGKTRGVLLILDDGNPALVLFDKDGKMRVRLDASKLGFFGVGLSLFDEIGKGRAALLLTPTGMPVLNLTERIPDAALGLTLTQSSLFLTDKDDKVIWRAP